MTCVKAGIDTYLRCLRKQPQSFPSSTSWPGRRTPAPVTPGADRDWWRDHLAAAGNPIWSQRVVSRVRRRSIARVTLSCLTGDRISPRHHYARDRTLYVCGLIKHRHHVCRQREEMRKDKKGLALGCALREGSVDRRKLRCGWNNKFGLIYARLLMISRLMTCNSSTIACERASRIKFNNDNLQSTHVSEKCRSRFGLHYFIHKSVLQAISSMTL